MTSPRADWDRWIASWQSTGTTPPALQALGARLQREQRRVRLIGVAEAGAVAVAVAGIGLAVSHAPTPADLVHGGVVVAIILVIAGLRFFRRRPEPAVGAATTTFLALSLRSRERQLQFVRFAWVLAGLELAFLVPWWIGGYQVHGDALGPLGLLTAWLPLSLILGFLVWTVRLRNRIRREIAELRRLQRQLHEVG